MSDDKSIDSVSPWSREGVSPEATQPAADPATPTTPATPATPPQGWYPDPADAQRQRFWDGTNWTAETRPHDQPAVPPAGAYPPVAQAGAPGTYPPVAPNPYQGAAPNAYPGTAPNAYPQQNTYPPAYPATAPAPQPGATPAPAYPPSVSPTPWGAAAATPWTQPQPAPSAPPAYPPVGPNGYLGAPAAPAAYNVRPGGKTTADGVPLAGWWWRVLASIIDSMIIGAVFGTLLSATVFRSMWSGYLSAMESAMNGQGDINAAVGALTQQMPALQLCLAVVMLVYGLIMLMSKGATLGMLACRLRVVPVGQGNHQGGLPVGEAVTRVIAYFVLTSGLSYLLLVVGGPAALSNLVSFVLIFNYLWAAWDAKGQTWHDKIARTQVVRIP